MDKHITQVISKNWNLNFTNGLTKLILSFDLSLSLDLYFEEKIQTNFDYIMKLDYRTLYEDIVKDFENKCFKQDSDDLIYLDDEDRKKAKKLIKKKILKNMFE